MTKICQAHVQAQTKVRKTDILAITLPMFNRMKVEKKSDIIITSYVRAAQKLVRFYGLAHPRDLDINEMSCNKLVDSNKNYYWRMPSDY